MLYPPRAAEMAEREFECLALGPRLSSVALPHLLRYSPCAHLIPAQCASAGSWLQNPRWRSLELLQTSPYHHTPDGFIRALGLRFQKLYASNPSCPQLRGPRLLFQHELPSEDPRLTQKPLQMPPALQALPTIQEGYAYSSRSKRKKGQERHN